ncbi:MAG: STY4526/YPO1902 family pathogenicity island replication protein [Geminicoccaceae bacterium]
MLDTDHQSALLTHAMLSSLAGALPIMDPRRVRSMGINAQQARRIATLTTSDMMRLAMRGAPYLRFQFDPDLLDLAIAEIDEEAGEQRLILDFVAHGASRDMMVEFFNVSHRHYARLRQSLGLPSNVGRPKECLPDDAERILTSWENRDMASDPKTLLSIAQDLDLDLRTVWDEIAGYLDDRTRSGISDPRLRDASVA